MLGDGRGGGGGVWTPHEVWRQNLGKVQPRSPNKRKTWEALLPQDAKVGEKYQFWIAILGHI